MEATLPKGKGGGSEEEYESPQHGEAVQSLSGERCRRLVEGNALKGAVISGIWEGWGKCDYKDHGIRWLLLGVINALGKQGRPWWLITSFKV